MLNCDQALELISAKVDNALTAEESAALEEHLAACAACRALLAEFEALHRELPSLAAQPPAALKGDIMAAVCQSKVTPFQGKKTQWRWRSLASLAAVLVLVVAGSSALRQWDGAASRSGIAQIPAGADAEVAMAQDTDSAALAAQSPEEQEQAETVEKSGRNLESGETDAQRSNFGEEAAGNAVSSTTPAPAQEMVPAAEPNTFSIAPEQQPDPTGLPNSAATAGLTQAEAVEQLALWLGWPADSLTADSSGVLTGPSQDGVSRTITCVGLNEAGTGWLCQVEEHAPGPEGNASCITYTVLLDGSGISQP